MQLARRLYFYFVAAVSLAALSLGLVNLLELLLSALRDAVSSADVIAADSDAVRRNLSIYAAITIVALPIWLLHWIQAERGLRGADADTERRSAARALYLTVILTGAFIAGTVAMVRLIQIGVLRLADADSGRVPGNGEQWIALTAVSGAVFVYHGLLRLRDMRGGPMSGAADWLPRLYVYTAAMTGLTLATFAAGDLLALVVEVLTTDAAVLVGNDAWDGVLASGVARAVAGAGLWTAHWYYSLRLTEAADWRGEHARASSLRRFYGYAVAFGAVLFALLLITRVGDAILSEAFGVDRQGTEPFSRRFLDPLVRAMPFVAVWLCHRRIVLHEATRFSEGARQATVRRVYVYAVALIGLGLTAFGLAGLISVTIDRVGERSGAVIVTRGDPWLAETANLAALTIVGAAAWLWHWSQAQQSLRHNTSAERTSTVRRAYLLIIIAGGVIALLTSLAIVIYRIFAELLGVNATQALDEPLAVLAIAIAVLAYHALLLRSDLASGVVEMPNGQTTFSLVISGPAGGDAATLVNTIQASLPSGYVVKLAPERDQ